MALAASVIFTAAAISSVLADQLNIHLIDHKNNVTDTRFCSAETASFGSNYLFYDIMGVVVNADPVNACHPVLPPPFQRNDSQTWVALIARDRSLTDGCPFDRKILNAQTAGFGAVLVYNYEDAVITMQTSDVGIRVRIPAAMVPLSCGVAIASRCAYSVSGNRYSLSFDTPFIFDFQVYVIAFAVIVGVCLLLSILVWGIKLYRDWRRSRRNRLPRSSLKKIKVKKFEKGTDPYDCCAICLEDFEPGERLRILPCNHAYHTKCVDPWLLKSRSTCPVCKRRVFPPSADSDDEGEGANAAGGGVGASTSVSGGAGAPDGDGPGGTFASVDDSGGVLSPDASDTASVLQHNERTPLLGAVAAAGTLTTSAATLAASASSSTAAATTVVVGFDNAGLLADDSAVEETETDVESLDNVEPAVGGSAAGGGVSVHVVVHRSHDEAGTAMVTSADSGDRDSPAEV